MAIAVLHRTRIAGVASAVPKHVVSNSDFTVISEEKRERVIKYTGIRYRRIATGDLCCSDMCQASAQKLIAELGWKPADIDVVIMVSQTCDYAFPTTAQLLQARLGLSKSCLALDVNLGCSGYPYGIFILGSLLEASGLKRGLLLVGDASKLPIGSDPASAVLFGHAGTATAIESSENSNPIFFEMGSDGGGHKVIYSPAGGARNPVSAASFEKVPLETGGARMDVNGILDAAEIMNFTLREVPVSVRRLLEKAGKTVAEVDAYIFHQANLLINNQVGRKIGIKPEQTPMSLYNFGNTSSASIPLTITTQLREPFSKKTMQMVMSGFGIGLSWSSAYWDAENVICPELIEL